ncbi:MAG: hypothetical protein HYR84_11725 [Planctomycetes bacterium]|nr:hypothetical protein [Planctomycetota bacterium]
MSGSYRWLLLLVGLAVLAGCERAKRYRVESERPRENTERNGDDPDAGLYRVSWHAGRERADTPILFVPDTHPDWPALKDFWNPLPVSIGAPTAHVGLGPMQALSAFVLAQQHATQHADPAVAIRIKVPRGLPDPGDDIPKSNPPTLGQWRLGRKLFFERRLPLGDDVTSCAACHDPNANFAETLKRPAAGGKLNTLSLVNVLLRTPELSTRSSTTSSASITPPRTPSPAPWQRTCEPFCPAIPSTIAPSISGGRRKPTSWKPSISPSFSRTTRSACSSPTMRRTSSMRRNWERNSSKAISCSTARRAALSAIPASCLRTMIFTTSATRERTALRRQASKRDAPPRFPWAASRRGWSAPSGRRPCATCRGRTRTFTTARCTIWRRSSISSTARCCPPITWQQP